MPTFLATGKMAPELAARISASVRGRTRGPGKAKGVSRGRRSMVLAGCVAVAAAISITVSVVRLRRQERRELEQARATLLGDVRERARALSPENAAFLSRAESWLERLARPYDGDLVVDDLRAPGAMHALFRRPIVYVRGAVGAFGNSAQIAETASTSFKDALLLCLVNPPASRTEKAVLGRVLLAYRGGDPVEQETPNARLVEEAEIGLPFLMPPWEGRVRGATDRLEIGRLTRELHNAPTERAIRAAHDSLLVAAMDEPGVSNAPTELDGERPHDVRLAAVDLAAGKLLVRVRRHVDPNWISVEKRPMYALGLDSCAFSYEVVAEFNGNK